MVLPWQSIKGLKDRVRSARYAMQGMCSECSIKQQDYKKQQLRSCRQVAVQVERKQRNGTKLAVLGQNCKGQRRETRAMTSVGEECLRKSHVQTANKPCCSWCGPFLSLEIYISHPKQSFNLFRNISNAFLRSHEASCHLSLLSLTAHCVDYSDWLFARI